MARVNDAGLNAGGRVRQVGNHMIALYATDCPYTAMAPKGEQVFNSTPEWPFKTRPSAETTPVADGADIVDSDMADYESLFGMLQGRVVQTRKPVGVGKRAQKLSRHYGRPKDKFAEYTGLAIEAIALGMENINLGMQDSYRETVSSQPRDMTRGFLRWLQPDGGTYIPIDLPVPSAACAPSGNLVTSRATTAAAVEDDVRGVMKSIADGTKRKKSNYVMFVSTAMQEVINNWGYAQTQSTTSLPLRRFTQDSSKKEISLEITSYKGSFGNLSIMPHLEMLNNSSSYATVFAATSDNGFGRTATAQKMDAALQASVRIDWLLVNFEFVKIYDIQQPEMEVLPNNGGGPRGAVDALWINAIENPKAHGAGYYRTA